MAAKYFDDGFSVGDGYTNWEPGLKDYESGLSATPWGYVSIYIQGDHNYTAATVFRFVFNGRNHTRSYQKRFTRLGAARKAKDFAREITQGENDEQGHD